MPAHFLAEKSRPVYRQENLARCRKLSQARERRFVTKKMKIPKSLVEEYKSLEPILNKCIAELKRIIETQLGKIQNPRLVRIRLTEARIKSLRSLWEKTQKKKWKRQDIFTKVKDLVGFRIVCANIEDIYRVKELLLSNPRLEEIPASEEDRTITPSPSGYRDFKFYVLYKTGDVKHSTITCEIQIRTILQDMWAILTHEDIYKEGDSLPKSLKKLSYRLSDLLHIADQIAQDIRDEIFKRREPKKYKGKKVSENALRILYKKAFNELPPDYLIHLVKNKCKELGIVNIKQIEKALLSEKNIKHLKNAYIKATGWDIYNELVFEMSPLLVIYGIEVAVDAVTKYGKQEWGEADQIFKREILPDTFEEFLRYLEPHTKDDYSDFPDRIYRLAEALNAIKKCSLCGAPIVDEDIFSQKAQEYYGVEDPEYRIIGLVLNSGADVGEGSLCSYHAYRKDD